MGIVKRPGFLLTANFTETGSPAYRDRDHRWTGDAAQAALFESEEQAKPVADQARATEQRLVTDPYVVKVQLSDDGGFSFLSARERIRAKGPTTPVRRPDRG